MTFTVDSVDPRERVEEVASVLQAAWSPPRLRYAPEDLAWQFARPSWAAPRGWIARDGEGRAVGFSALMPRFVRAFGEIREAWLASFYAARPGASGVALTLIRAVAKALREGGRPAVVFAEPESPGEVMLRAWDSLGLRRRPLGTLRVHGGMARGGGLTLCREAAPDEILPRLIGGDSKLLRDVHDAATLAHDASDPRGRCWAVVDSPEGPMAAGCVFVTESIGREGRVRTASLTSVSAASGEALASLMRFAAGRWEDLSSPIVTLSNPSGLDNATLRSIGLRASTAAWAAYVFSPYPDDHVLQCDGTDVEII